MLDEKDFIEFIQQYKDFENKLNSGVLEYDTEVYGPVTEVISQYLVPGMGLYKLYNNIIKIPGLTGILAKGLATDATLVTGVAPADEGNFVTFLKDTFNISEQNSGKVISAMVDYIGTVSNDPSAAGVAEQKFKNVLGDFPVALLAELIVPVVRLLSKAKNNAQSTTSNISSDSCCWCRKKKQMNFFMIKTFNNQHVSDLALSAGKGQQCRRPRASSAGAQRFKTITGYV